MENQSDEKIINELNLIRDLSGYEVLDKIYSMDDIDTKYRYLKRYISRTKKIIKDLCNSQLKYLSGYEYKSLSNITKDKINIDIPQKQPFSIVIAPGSTNWQESFKEEKLEELILEDDKAIYSLLLVKAESKFENTINQITESTSNNKVETKPNYNLKYFKQEGAFFIWQYDIKDFVCIICKSKLVKEVSNNKNASFIYKTKLFYANPTKPFPENSIVKNIGLYQKNSITLNEGIIEIEAIKEFDFILKAYHSSQK